MPAPSDAEEQTNRELALKYKAIRILTRQITLDNSTIEIAIRDQQLAVLKAASDFTKHNREVKVFPKNVDLIKVVAFVGCHLLSCVAEDHRKCVIRSLVTTLDSLAANSRRSVDGRTPCGLPSDHLHLLMRLITKSSESISRTEPEDVWGHGFWRVGLYAAFQSAAKSALV